MYAHLARLARSKKTVGFFCETGFESIHALCNQIERLYLAFTCEKARDKNIRRALAVKQDRAGRAARAKMLKDRARGPRSETDQ
jgi:hypothetical protein